MGGPGAMAWTTILCLVLYTLPHMQAQDVCCNIKIVSGALAEDKGLAGTYNLLRNAGEAPDTACANGCVYSREGAAGEEYCFQAVAAGADIEDQECNAVTGTTEPAGSQTPASSDELRKQAEEAAARVEENNDKITETNQNIENAESATDAINKIQEKLSPTASTPGRRVREKRQESTGAPTPMPVAEPATCDEFGEKYKELLALAVDVTDDNIDQIKVYVDALINVDIVGLCDDTARANLATDTKEDADKAVESTQEYTDAKVIIVIELKQKVNDDIALQTSINEELEDRGESTVPVAASTHAIEPTTPSDEGGETPDGGPATEGETPEGTPPSEGETPEGTQPAEGETPEGTPPAEGETPAGTEPVEGETPEGTPPAEGETPPPEGTPPTEGETPEGTPPAESETPEGTPPAEGETPDGTPPPQISTAKPGRLLFERKRRSRGSMF